MFLSNKSSQIWSNTLPTCCNVATAKKQDVTKRPAAFIALASFMHRFFIQFHSSARLSFGAPWISCAWPRGDLVIAVASDTEPLDQLPVVDVARSQSSAQIRKQRWSAQRGNINPCSSRIDPLSCKKVKDPRLKNINGCRKQVGGQGLDVPSLIYQKNAERPHDERTSRCQVKSNSMTLSTRKVR